MSTEPRLIFDDRRNPFHLFMVSATVLAGVGGLINPGRASAVVREFFPAWQLYVWYGGLTVGGALALTGLFLTVSIGYDVERIGLVLLTGLCLSYCTAIVIGGTQFFALGGLSVMAFTVACCARLVRVHRIRR